jgi:hypothetical protein
MTRKLAFEISELLVIVLLLILRANAQGTFTPRGKQSSAENNAGETYAQLFRADIRKQKSSVMERSMLLEPDQAAKFWPIYREYEAELSRSGDEILALVQKFADNYANMSGGVADELAAKSLSIERERNELKSKYYQRFRKALGPKIAARFLQVESQLLKLLDLQLASSLQLIQ